MKRQYKFDKNLGRDLHTRPAAKNLFQRQSARTFETVVGEVLAPQPEPLFRQTTVSVKLARGGMIKSVPYPGAFIEPLSGNVHGLYEGPIPGQMVTIGFANGNSASPYVVNRYPYQGTGNSFTELDYVNPLSRAGFHSFDVIMGHFSGSLLSFNTGILPSTKLPGSVTLKAMTDLELNSTLFIQIKNSVQSMKTLIDSLFDLLDGFATTGSPTSHVTDPATKALIVAEKAKWALLLKE